MKILICIGICLLLSGCQESTTKRNFQAILDECAGEMTITVHHSTFIFGSYQEITCSGMKNKQDNQ